MDGATVAIALTAAADSPCGSAKKTSSHDAKSSGEKAEKR